MEKHYLQAVPCHEGERATRPTIEKRLILELKKKFISSADITRLAHGIHNMRRLHISEVVASVYEWAFSNKEIQKLLIDKFFEHTASEIEKAYINNAKNKIAQA